MQFLYLGLIVAAGLFVGTFFGSKIALDVFAGAFNLNSFLQEVRRLRRRSNCSLWVGWVCSHEARCKRA